MILAPEWFISRSNSFPDTALHLTHSVLSEMADVKTSPHFAQFFPVAAVALVFRIFITPLLQSHTSKPSPAAFAAYTM
jgi:hypothetical protein